MRSFIALALSLALSLATSVVCAQTTRSTAAVPRSVVSAVSAAITQPPTPPADPPQLMLPVMYASRLVRTPSDILTDVVAPLTDAACDASQVPMSLDTRVVYCAERGETSDATVALGTLLGIRNVLRRHLQMTAAEQAELAPRAIAAVTTILHARGEHGRCLHAVEHHHRHHNQVARGERHHHGHHHNHDRRIASR